MWLESWCWLPVQKSQFLSIWGPHSHCLAFLNEHTWRPSWKLQYFLGLSPDSVWNKQPQEHGCEETRLPDTWKPSWRLGNTSYKHLVQNLFTMDCFRALHTLFSLCFAGYTPSGIQIKLTSLLQRWSRDSNPDALFCAKACLWLLNAIQSPFCSQFYFLFATMGTREWASQEYWWLLKHIYKITWDSMSLICYLAEE